ncbi:hypothetical protein PDR35_15425 [Bacillus cereus]|nr:hypothetical protein [Bacillus cereus]
MKLFVMSSDEALINKIKERKVFTSVQQINDVEKSSKDGYLLISDRVLPYSELSTIEFENKKVFYMLENQYKPQLESTVKAICNSKDIYLIPPRLVVEQIVDFIDQNLNLAMVKKTNIITFFSSVSNIGTTSTCLSVGKALSQYTNAKVGVLLLNAWDSGTDQLNFKGNYMDQVKSKLASKTISSEQEFLSQFHMVNPNLYILGGNRDTKMERLFTKEEINYLIEHSKQTFDVVLVDAGSHFDNANMVQALNESNLRFLIMNQQTKAIRKFNQFHRDILYPLGYEKEDLLMIINQFEDLSHLPTTKDIHKDIDIPLLTTIEKSENGMLSEIERTVLYDYEDIGYKQSINAVAKSIASSVDLIFNDELQLPRRRKFLGIL